jgi:hypothetical protein
MPTALRANVVDQQDNTPQFLAAIGKNIGDVMVAAKNSENNRRLYAAQTAAEQLNSLKTIFDVYGQEGYSPAMVLENGFAAPVLKGLLKNLDVASGISGRPDSYYEDATNKMMLDAQSSISTASEMNWVLHHEGETGSEAPPPQPTQPTPSTGSQTSGKNTASPSNPNPGTGGGQGGKTGTGTGAETGPGTSGPTLGSPNGGNAGGSTYKGPPDYHGNFYSSDSGGSSNNPQAFPQSQTAPQTVLPGATPAGTTPTPQPESNRPPSSNYTSMPQALGQQDAFAPQQQAPYIPPDIVARMRAQNEAQQQYYTQNPPQPMPYPQDRPQDAAAQNFQYEFPRTQPQAIAAQNFQPSAQAAAQAQVPPASAAQPSAPPAPQPQPQPGNPDSAAGNIYSGIKMPANYRQTPSASSAPSVAPPSGATKPSPTLVNPQDTGGVTYVKLAPMTDQEVAAAKANWNARAQYLMQKDSNSGVPLDPQLRRAQMEQAAKNNVGPDSWQIVAMSNGAGNGKNGQAGGGGGQKPAVPLSAKDVVMYAARPGSDAWDSGNTAIDLSTGESNPKDLAFGKNGVAWVTAPGTSFKQLQGQTVAGFQFGNDPDMKSFIQSITSKPDITLALMKAGYLIPLSSADDVAQYYKARGFVLSPADEANIRSRAEKAIGAAKGTLDVPLYEIPEPLIPDYWKSQSQAPVGDQNSQYAEFEKGLLGQGSGQLAGTTTMTDTGPRGVGSFPGAGDTSPASTTQPSTTQSPGMGPPPAPAPKVPAKTQPPESPALQPPATPTQTGIPPGIQAAAAKASAPHLANTAAGASGIASGEIPPSQPGEAAVANMTLRDTAKAETAIQGFFTGLDSRRVDEIKQLQVSKNANPPPIPQSQNIFQQAIDTLNKFIQSPQTELTALDKAKIDRAAIVANSWSNAVWNQLSPAERIDLVKKANTFFDNMSSTQAEMLYGHNAATTVNTENEILLNLARAQLEGERLAVQNNIALAQTQTAIENQKMQLVAALIGSITHVVDAQATLASNPKVSLENNTAFSASVTPFVESIAKMISGVSGVDIKPLVQLVKERGGFLGLGSQLGVITNQQLPATQTGQTTGTDAAVDKLIKQYSK